jgi:predicted RNase H-like HicB family nuclease
MSANYVAIVHKDSNSSYGIHFPDVPGCHSAADCVCEIARNARAALALHFEDGEAIKPRSLDEIRASGDADEDLANGAELIVIETAA